VSRNRDEREGLRLVRLRRQRIAKEDDGMHLTGRHPRADDQVPAIGAMCHTLDV